MESNLTAQPLTSCRMVRAATWEQLLVIENIKPKLMEMVNIYSKNGKMVRGQIVELSGNKAVAQVFEEMTGMSLSEVRVECTGEVFKMPVSEDMIGGFFDGSGKPRDKTFASYPEKHVDIQSRPINPVARQWPNGIITTGVGAIDLMNTIAIGRVYTIYSAAGLPHNELAAQIIRQAAVVKPEHARNFSEEFTIVFAGIGLSNDAMRFFTAEFKELQSKHQVTSFMNCISDPIHERLLTPRLALTFAEYLAYEKQKHVMVVITDMEAYCGIMQLIDRNVSKRQKYPSYLGSDLASLFERGGIVEGSSGSLTIVPIMTVPADDMTHPMVDLMGAFTENYLVLSRQLHNRGIYPPIDVMAFYKIPTVLGYGLTREDHRSIVFQLDVLYAKGHEIATYRAVVGESFFDPNEQLYLNFKDAFDRRMINQSWNESRDLMKTYDLAWELLRIFPRDNLTYIYYRYLDLYYAKK